MADHMQTLVEMGSTGLDLSPGDPTAKWAAETIAELRARIAQLELSVEHYKELAARWENEAKTDLAENQRLRADADRLDWLCDNATLEYMQRVFVWHPDSLIRDAIDAARGAK